MSKKPDLYSIIHLCWLLASLVIYLAVDNDLLPPAFFPLKIYWGLVGLLTFILVMLRHVRLVAAFQRSNELHQKEVNQLKAEMFDLEKQKVQWQRKVEEKGD